MKTGIAVAVLLSAALLAGTAAAQVRGIAPSVTSFAPGRGMAPGIPASVTSLGPRGFSPRGFKFTPRFFVPHNTFNPCSGSLIPAALGCQNGLLNPPPFFGFSGFPRRRFGPRGFFPGGGFGYGAGYAYPYAYPVDYSAAEEVPMAPEPEVEEVEPQGPAPTIFDRRGTYVPPRATAGSRYGEPYPETREGAQAREEETQPAAARPAATPIIPTVLVYRDGHRQQVTSYAIVGDTLYEIDAMTRTHKVKLAELDLQATVQANEANGIDFNLPSPAKQTRN